MQKILETFVWGSNTLNVKQNQRIMCRFRYESGFASKSKKKKKKKKGISGDFAAAVAAQT